MINIDALAESHYAKWDPAFIDDDEQEEDEEEDEQEEE